MLTYPGTIFLVELPQYNDLEWLLRDVTSADIAKGVNELHELLYTDIERTVAPALLLF